MNFTDGKVRIPFFANIVLGLIILIKILVLVFTVVIIIKVISNPEAAVSFIGNLVRIFINSAGFNK